MDVAVERLQRAIQDKERIAVFGDYDVDGATSASMLIRFFRSIGLEIGQYIPDRIKEGYGPNRDALLKLKEAGADVVLTVDCGITAFDPLSTAQEAGLDVIVIDHHKADTDLPVAAAVVNPNRLDDSSGQGHLAAVGVVFMVLVALNRVLRLSGWYETNDVAEPDLRQWLDLVALGTVCDVVPLKGLNRAFVAQGLTILSRSQNEGLKALARVSRMDGPPRAFHLGYLLGPRVNAGGRVGEADLGTRLLANDDPDEAAALALRLDELNGNRKDIEATVLMKAIEQAESATGTDSSMVFVAGYDWHPGVIGIVASRLRERYNLPAFVVALDGGMAKGSGRSVPGVDLGRAVLLARDADILFNGGGHAMAAGFTVEQNKLDALRKFLAQAINNQRPLGDFAAPYSIDAVLSPEGATMEFLKDLANLEPYGSGNEEPKVAIAGARVFQSDIVGQGHVRCVISGSSGSRLKAIAFNSTDSDLGHALLSNQGRPFHLAGRLREDTWKGRSNVQLVIEDGAWAE